MKKAILSMRKQRTLKNKKKIMHIKGKKKELFSAVMIVIRLRVGRSGVGNLKKNYFGSGTHLASCLMGIGGSFRGGEVAGTRGCSLLSI